MIQVILRFWLSHRIIANTIKPPNTMIRPTITNGSQQLVNLDQQVNFLCSLDICTETFTCLLLINFWFAGITSSHIDNRVKITITNPTNTQMHKKLIQQPEMKFCLNVTFEGFFLVTVHLIRISPLEVESLWSPLDPFCQLDQRNFLNDIQIFNSTICATLLHVCL